MTDDHIDRPYHYASWRIEPIKFIMANRLPFWQGNIIKYAMRAGLKSYPQQDLIESEITDLMKVIRYAEMRINELEGRDPTDDNIEE